MNVMDEIIAARRRRIEREGHELGHAVPTMREVPLVPFGVPQRAIAQGAAAQGAVERDAAQGAVAHGAATQDTAAQGAAAKPRGAASSSDAHPADGAGRRDDGRFLVCEIKRRSPSKGVINDGLDAASQAALYAARGVRSVSVLTEEERFGGSLDDLIAVKRRRPDLAVLRKDFLIDEEDIDVSYRAGADAVLLIAGALEPEQLARLHQRAAGLGMAVLVEVHSAAEAALVAPLQPPLTGINARDLTTFAVDPVAPLLARRAVNWTTRLVYESGIASEEDAAFAASSGFDGILVGEAVVRRPELIPELFSGLTSPAARFWGRLFETKRPGRPLVKICGLTRAEDVRLADELGADVLGFIFAPSKRRVDPTLFDRLEPTRALRVAVVVLRDGERELPPEVAELLASGRIDAVQLHGDERPDDCYHIAFPYYKALRLRDAAGAPAIASYRCPRVLVDAFVEGARGGTGVRLPLEAAEAAARERPLWIAGGVNPDNVAAIVRDLRPELVDSSSGVESEPGRKDHERLKALFRALDAAAARARESAS